MLQLLYSSAPSLLPFHLSPPFGLLPSQVIIMSRNNVPKMKWFLFLNSFNRLFYNQTVRMREEDTEQRKKYKSLDNLRPLVGHLGTKTVWRPKASSTWSIRSQINEDVAMRTSLCSHTSVRSSQIKVNDITITTTESMWLPYTLRDASRSAELINVHFLQRGLLVLLLSWVTWN